MALPSFNAEGELPPGVHPATWAEVRQRFGAKGGQRWVCTQRLTHIRELSKRTGFLRRFVVFGSFITAKSEPNDVDIVLVMDDGFHLYDCPVELRGLFEHAVAQGRHGASIFWLRAGMLIGESVEEFIAYWQVKRGGGRRGIVEMI